MPKPEGSLAGSLVLIGPSDFGIRASFVIRAWEFVIEEMML